MSTKISELEVSIQSNASKASKGIDALATSLSKVKSVSGKVSTNLNGTNESVKKLGTSVNNASLSWVKFAAKATVAVVAVKKIASAIWSAVDKSMSYYETVNLFSVSMGEYAVEAKEYADTVSEIMGIDPADWMKYQGTIMTLATGFGVASDRAYTMSQQLTQLAYDISSFRDLKVEDAMLKIQSGFAGELEPLRAIGYDLSQAKLEAIALSLGIDKSVSSMTQAEKAQLRYYAIMTQVTSAQGDMARTLTSPANQVRIFKAQLTQAARAIGNIFIPALNAILPYAIAVVKVIRILADSIANLFGYEMPEVDYSGASTAASQVAESTGEATESAKKLKKYMMGFDELNVIGDNSDSSSVEDIASQFNFDLPTYDFIGEATNSKINTIVEEMKEWLGITGEITTWADLLDTRLGSILKTVGLIGAGFATWKIGTGIISGLTTAIASISAGISKMSGLWSGFTAAIGAISTPAWIAVGAVLALVAGLTTVYLTNEDVRKSVNEAVANIGEAFIPLITYITDTVVPNLLSAWNGLMRMLAPLGEWLSMVFTSIWMDMIVPALTFVGDKVIPDLIGVFKNLWENVFVPLGEFLGRVFTPIINILSTVLTWLWQYVIIPLADCIGGVLSTAWNAIVKILTECVIPKMNRVIDVFNFLWDTVLSPLITFLWNTFKPRIKAVFEAIGDIVGGIKKVFSGLIDFITGMFTQDWKQALGGIVSFFTGIWEAVAGAIKIPFNAVLGGIETFLNKILDGMNWLKKQINTISFEVPDWVPLIGGKSFGFNIPLSAYVSLPRLADGAYDIPSGQMFIAREAGAEMVGSIGRKTAVANNDQIVAGIANGVAEANGEQNVLLKEQNELLRALLEKDSGVYLDGKRLTNSVEKYQRERGRVLLSGGAY